MRAMPVVYMVTNRVNGKRYIGVTARSLMRRKAGHLYEARMGRQVPFHRALRKHGLENFDWAILEEHDTAEAAIAAEIRLIAEYRPQYNICKGGVGVAGLRHTEATRLKMKATQTPERRAAASLRLKGIPRTLEDRKKISIGKMGRPQLWRKGRCFLSPETIDRFREIGLANKDKWAKYAALGPMSQARAVICIDDGKIYPTGAAAAAAYGVAVSALRELCLGQRGRKTVGGLHFCYAREDENVRA